MSTYLAMWNEIKAMTPSECEAYIKHYSPAEGKSVLFLGLHVIDIDLLEALRHHIEMSS